MSKKHHTSKTLSGECLIGREMEKVPAGARAVSHGIPATKIRGSERMEVLVTANTLSARLSKIILYTHIILGALIWVNK